MKALSLLQPWASLVVLGKKQIETRSWSTSYRGRIAIHASKRFDLELRVIANSDPFYEALYGKDSLGFPEGLPTSAIIGTVEIVDCLTTSKLVDFRKWPLSETELAFGDYSPGRYGWILKNPIVFDKPIPAKGALSLWEWEGGNRSC